jgi:hypothetical protein
MTNFPIKPGAGISGGRLRNRWIWKNTLGNPVLHPWFETRFAAEVVEDGATMMKDLDPDKNNVIWMKQ